MLMGSLNETIGYVKKCVLAWYVLSKEDDYD